MHLRNKLISILYFVYLNNTRLQIWIFRNFFFCISFKMVALDSLRWIQPRFTVWVDFSLGNGSEKFKADNESSNTGHIIRYSHSFFVYLYGLLFLPSSWPHLVCCFVIVSMLLSVWGWVKYILIALYCEMKKTEVF